MRNFIDIINESTDARTVNIVIRNGQHDMAKIKDLASSLNVWSTENTTVIEKNMYAINEIFELALPLEDILSTFASDFHDLNEVLIGIFGDGSELTNIKRRIRQALFSSEDAGMDVEESFSKLSQMGKHYAKIKRGSSGPKASDASSEHMPTRY